MNFKNWLEDKEWCQRVGPNEGNFTAYGIEAIQNDAVKTFEKVLQETSDRMLHLCTERRQSYDPCEQCKAIHAEAMKLIQDHSSNNAHDVRETSARKTV